MAHTPDATKRNQTLATVPQTAAQLLTSQPVFLLASSLLFCPCFAGRL
jgi:hypothetical protein